MHPSGDSQLLPSGFSWVAAFAFPLWALTRRLYKTALVWFVALTAVSQLAPRLAALIDDPRLRAIAILAYTVTYWTTAGFLARVWHRHVLERDGYFVSAADATDLPGVKR
jgi:hypothetical protein